MYSTFILLPLLGVVILNILPRDLIRRVSFAVCLFILLLQVALSILPRFYITANRLDLFGAFLKLNFVMDDFSRLMLFIISAVLFSALLVQGYMDKEAKGVFNFSNTLLLVLAGMNGVVLVRDIFSLYVFLEITAVSSFILIGSNKELLASEAAFKYIVLSVSATVLMLLSIALLLLISGSTTFTSINYALRIPGNWTLVTLSIVLFLCACFIKAGIMPFHGWLPDVYSASPAPVSVLLAGIVTKVAGVYTLIRVVITVFGFTHSLRTVLLFVGGLSVVAGALAALTQKDFKRMLAYSSISQVGYIILGLGTATPLGVAGAIFHLFNHAVFKSLLFVNAAAVEQEAGTRDIDSLGGLSKKMPVTGLTSVLASLSAAGIPPLAGFWSKLMIIIALWISGFYIYAAVAVFASVITLAYLLSLQRNVFFGKLKEGLDSVKEAGPGVVLASLLLAALALGGGLFFPFILHNIIYPAARM